MVTHLLLTVYSSCAPVPGGLYETVSAACESGVDLKVLAQCVTV